MSNPVQPNNTIQPAIDTAAHVDVSSSSSGVRDIKIQRDVLPLCPQGSDKSSNKSIADRHIACLASLAELKEKVVSVQRGINKIKEQRASSIKSTKPKTQAKLKTEELAVRPTVEESDKKPTTKANTSSQESSSTKKHSQEDVSSTRQPSTDKVESSASSTILASDNIIHKEVKKYIPSQAELNMPKYKSLTSRLTSVVTPTKLMEGDSRVRHKSKHIEILKQSGNESFVKRNKSLDTIDSLKESARKAEVFEQNSDNRKFMKFIKNPTNYYRSMSHTVKIPKSNDNKNFTYSTVDLAKKVDEEIKKQGTEGVNISHDQALRNIAKEIAEKCQLYTGYCTHKSNQADRTNLIDQFVVNKEDHKTDIRKARDGKIDNILEENKLLDDINKKYPDIITEWDNSKKEIPKYEFILNKLNKQHETLRSDRNKLNKPLNIKIKEKFFSNIPFFSMKNKLDQLREKENDFYKKKNEVLPKIAELRKDIASINNLKSQIQPIERAAESMLKDLDYSLYRNKNP